jgi:hypothetical protein
MISATVIVAPPTVTDPVSPEIMLGVALSYAEKGWYVVPVYPPKNSICTCAAGDKCEHPGKHPRTKHGSRDATTDRAIIEGWFRRWPNSNIGLMLSLSDLIAIDVDPRHGGDATLADLEAKYGPLPATVQTLSGGGGRHFIFKAPDGTIKGGANKLGPGLDVIHKGCIIVPPSLHVSGNRYTFQPDFDPIEMPVAPLPPWVLSLIQPPPRAAVTSSAPGRPLDSRNRRAKPYIEKALQDEIAAVRTATDGARNDAMNVAAFNLGTLVGSGYLDRATVERELTTTALAAGLSEREIIKTLRSGLDSGIAQPRTIETNGRERRTMSKTPTAEPVECTAVLRNAADIVTRPVSWVWQNRIPAGKLSLLIGHPGQSKTLLALYMAGRLSVGGAWPDGALCEVGNTIILSGEDDVDDTLVPRLCAAGADLSRISFLDGVQWRDLETKAIRITAVDFDQHIHAIREAVDRTKANLFVVDPVTSFVGHVDDHRNSELRALLSALASVARDTGCAFVCISHLRKSGGLAVHQAVGSLAYVAACRAVWAVLADKNDAERRLLLPVKMNLCRDTSGLAYRVVSDPTGNGHPTLAWEPEPISLKADDVLNPETRPGPLPMQRDEAAEWLTIALASGPRNAEELINEAEAVGITLGTLRRAKVFLRVKLSKDGFQGPSVWSLPQARAKSAL